MGRLRALSFRHNRLALLLVLIALALKAAMPAGYMIGGGQTVLTVQVCADASGISSPQQIVLPQSGKSGESGADHGKADGTCPWSALSMGATSAADPLLLALALAFIVLLGFAPMRRPARAEPLYLRPPLRGPPELA